MVSTITKREFGEIKYYWEAIHEYQSAIDIAYDEIM